ESLYQNKNFSGLDLSEYIDGLARNLLMSHSLHGRVALEMDLRPVDLGLDQAIPCGLILNELISNALKHAFQTTGEGTITIALSLKDDTIGLMVRDDGVGMAEDFDLERDANLGLQLVSTLVDQLDGSL
ncbi:MAG: ATP-binding protein, partial [Flavobacteriales bacterium]|nr:ATP-binding protein [Flavobacteriales bacterium]